MGSNPVISIKGLKKRFEKVQALDGISLDVKPGEMFGLVGPDGAGKTTLLRILAGILQPDDGEAVILNRNINQDLDEIRGEIGYVSQKFNLYGDLTVEENIDFFAALYPSKRDKNEMKKELLDFIGLSAFKRRLAANLSGGMKQKLALLCALIHSPGLLLMDEPTTGVDPVSRREFWSIVFKLQKDGLTVLASTPYMDEAEQFDRIALMNKGVFMHKGTTDEIRRRFPGVVLEIICPKPTEARRILRKLPLVHDVELFGDKVHAFLDDDGAEELKAVREAMTKGGIKSESINRIPYSIEDIFLLSLSGKDSSRLRSVNNE